MGDVRRTVAYVGRVGSDPASLAACARRVLSGRKSEASGDETLDMQEGKNN
jgi:hypothetical protein